MLLCTLWYVLCPFYPFVVWFLRFSWSAFCSIFLRISCWRFRRPLRFLRHSWIWTRTWLRGLLPSWHTHRRRSTNWFLRLLLSISTFITLFIFICFNKIVAFFLRLLQFFETGSCICRYPFLPMLSRCPIPFFFTRFPKITAWVMHMLIFIRSLRFFWRRIIIWMLFRSMWICIISIWSLSTCSCSTFLISLFDIWIINIPICIFINMMSISIFINICLMGTTRFFFIRITVVAALNSSGFIVARFTRFFLFLISTFSTYIIFKSMFFFCLFFFFPFNKFNFPMLLRTIFLIFISFFFRRFFWSLCSSFIRLRSIFYSMIITSVILIYSSISSSSTITIINNYITIFINCAS